jgi:hypothetical protein
MKLLAPFQVSMTLRPCHHPGVDDSNQLPLFPARSELAAIKDGTAAVKVETVLDEIAKLKQLRALGLPEDAIPQRSCQANPGWCRWTLCIPAFIIVLLTFVSRAFFSLSWGVA